jgi:Ca2+-binding EF-hand superfamily protein
MRASAHVSFLPCSFTFSESFPILQFRRYREQELETVFQLVDTESKGYLTASDVGKLSAEVLGNAVPYKQAKRMTAFCSSDGRVDRHDLGRLLSPPSP